MRVAEGAGQKLCWNAGEFRVAYPSLATQLCIGGVFVRLLLDGVDQVNPLCCTNCICANVHDRVEEQVWPQGMSQARLQTGTAVVLLAKGYRLTSWPLLPPTIPPHHPSPPPQIPLHPPKPPPHPTGPCQLPTDAGSIPCSHDIPQLCSALDPCCFCGKA